MKSPGAAIVVSVRFCKNSADACGSSGMSTAIETSPFLVNALPNEAGLSCHGAPGNACKAEMDADDGAT